MGFASFRVPFLGLLVASFFIQGLEAVSCPLKWFLYEQHCYGFFENKLSWNDAETECASHGKHSHLASILSEREMDSIASNLLTNYGEGFRTWIGLYKLRGGKVRMRWIDASVTEYISWAVNQPSNCQGKQGCVELYSHTPLPSPDPGEFNIPDSITSEVMPLLFRDYKGWNDQYCEMKLAYLCKMAVY